MTENLKKKPAKGILKTSSSQEQAESNKSAADIKWDEMNILQTLHPADKDYGHMKIEEPKTPYSYYEDKSGQEISGHGSDTLDADLLAKKINLCSEKEDKSKAPDSPSSEEENEEEETEEEKAKRSLFEQKRKKHYNEFHVVKLARKLNDKDDDDDEQEEEEEQEEKEKQEEKEEHSN